MIEACTSPKVGFISKHINKLAQNMYLWLHDTSQAVFAMFFFQMIENVRCFHWFQPWKKSLKKAGWINYLSNKPLTIFSNKRRIENISVLIVSKIFDIQTSS